ncbi:MAG: ParB/RepB/Spo0J family partition protein [Candidatus Sericytochromatia bacterium]|nr:ParB/RepB/Spo0J family partition protein [Candidatus Sericytochromatia bacterium]
MNAATPAAGSFAALYEASRNLSLDAAPRQMRLAHLEPHPGQPRTLIDQEGLQELAASIRAHGVLQPLIVRPHPTKTPGRYEIIAGERRFRASLLAELDSVPVVIRQVDDVTARQVALIENLQREDISPLEEARVLQQILEDTQWSHRQLGEKIGKSKTYVEQRIRMLRYPAEVQDALALSEKNPHHAFHPGHAKAVVQIGDAGIRQQVIAEIQTKQMSVRETEQRVARLRAKKNGAMPRKVPPCESMAIDTLSVTELLKPMWAAGATHVNAETLRSALREDLQRLQ